MNFKQEEQKRFDELWKCDGHFESTADLSLSHARLLDLVDERIKAEWENEQYMYRPDFEVILQAIRKEI